MLMGLRLSPLLLCLGLSSTAFPFSIADPSTSISDAAPGERAIRSDLWSDHGVNSEEPRLESQQTRLSGYLLPLDYSGAEITEFLLVPYVGACVQTPCPETDQLVHVLPDQGVQVDGVFDPIRITGLLVMESGSYDLSLLQIDGAAKASYRMRASLVELY